MQKEGRGAGLKRGICFIRDGERENESKGGSGYGSIPDSCFHYYSRSGLALAGRLASRIANSLLSQPSLVRFRPILLMQVTIDLRH